MRAFLLLAAILTTSVDHGDDPPTPTRNFAVRCGTIFVGDGRVLRDATMVVVNGRVEAIGSGASAPSVPEDMPVLDASDKTIMPGIVVADSDISGHEDAPYNVTPDFVAIDGFDFERRYPRVLSGGVTTVYLSPGRNRLVSGQGSVVKTWGNDLVQRVLAENACLRVNLGPSATKAPPVFEPTPQPTSDDPLEPARKQYPTARISMLSVLRQIFRDAAAGVGERNEGTAVEDRYAIDALQQAASGVLPLRIASSEAADLRRALFLGRELGASMVLENPHEIERVAEQAAQQGASAVFRFAVRPGTSNPGGEDRDVDEPMARPDNPALAAAAGLRIALAPGHSDDLTDMLLVAGVAIRHGLDPDTAMRALTSDAAEILGVSSRVGSLETGKDADFLVLSGEPFAIGTMVEKTFVDGEPAFEREMTSGSLAVRTGRILTMADQSLRDGMVIAQDGVIRTVGEDLAIPYGARVIDIPGGVMVPGFIDAYSHLGLSGEGTGIPDGAADQRVADVVTHDDPMFRAALEAGVTTVLVSGKDSALVSGRVAALKTGAADDDSMRLKETAAIRFVYDAIEPDGIKAMADAIERGKKYIEKWEKYEQAVADYEAGLIEKPPEEEETSEENAEDPVTGLWEIKLAEAPPFPLSLLLELELEGTSVTGALVFSFRGQERDFTIDSGSFEGGTLTLELRAPMMGQATITATVANDSMRGTIASPQQNQDFTAKRVDKPDDAGGGSDDDDDGAPTKPNIDESLEPLRELLEHRIPAVVRANRGPAISRVVEWFAEQKLSYVLTGIKDAVDTPELLGETTPAVALDPDILHRDGKQTVNAAAMLADRGHPVALGTGSTAGSRYLPVHAAMSVRYGMDPTEALRAMTAHTAEIFKISDRVGSIERGKDADFVVFSGSPFEMTSRVLLVVVNGRVVVDNRNEAR